MAQLGSDNGPGFGWQSVNVIKVGMEIHPVGPFTVRLGYNHSTNPVQSRDVTFNILAPGVVKDHATFGVTYDLTHKSELTLAYMHAFRNTVSGNSLLLGGQEKIYMFQNSIGVAFGHRF
jgi:Outer membrane protein transport protein (OMPP1/FadL/TodX).